MEEYNIGKYPISTLHANLFYILKEIERLCKKYNITYVLTGGSALGAMRHNDFIPWDDDMDIGFSRKNYNKFIKASKKDLGKEFYLDSLETNKKWGQVSAKLRLLNTYFPEEWSIGTGAHNCVWVDIYAYDKCPDFLCRFNRRIARFFNRIRIYKLNVNINFRGKRLLKMFSWIPQPILNFLSVFPNKCMNFLPLKYVRNMSFDMKILKFKIPKKSFENVRYVDFHNTKQPVPFNVEELLTKKYGDWKSLPSVEYRKSSHTKDDKIILREDII